MKQLTQADLSSNVTENGAKLTWIQFRDKLTGQYLTTKQINRATLAKWYHEQKITHAYNGLPVIDI